MPLASRLPVLIYVLTKLGMVAFVENKLAADIKLDTKSVDVVIPLTLIEGAEISLLANKLPPIYRSLPTAAPPAIVIAPPDVILVALNEVWILIPPKLTNAPAETLSDPAVLLK